MHTIFAQAVQAADGRYLDDSQLHRLEQYIQSYRARSEAYQILSSKADELVLQTLRQLAITHRQEVQTHASKCKRDMAYALKYIARAVLTDESETFKEDFALWMENITRAVHRSDSAARAYRCLKAEVEAALAPECAALITPYIDDLISAFTGN